MNTTQTKLQGNLIPQKILRSFLSQKQSLPLDAKIIFAERSIREFYEKMDGKVRIAFSGGKDSTVMLHLVRNIYPDVPALFVDTGLEYPEIREFVKTTDNVAWLKPEMSFKQVLERYGYPVVSKRIARMLRVMQNPTPDNKATRRLFVTGYKTCDGTTSTSGFSILPTVWRDMFLDGWKDFNNIDDVTVKAPFKISEQCCDIMKKYPSDKYDEETGTFQYVGVMACDSGQRKTAILRKGCNSFDGKIQSRPLAYWMQDDIWAYIKRFNLPYSKIYDMDEKHTGCMFCMFGIHLDKCPNRFQRMKQNHRNLYDYCINKLDLKEILDFMNIPY
jgi:3'-phosphoadenosine 5'-phosphosulfate sulfotransferase (PAPS reductase)/FAD synthetase